MCKWSLRKNVNQCCLNYLVIGISSKFNLHNISLIYLLIIVINIHSHLYYWSIIHLTITLYFTYVFFIVKSKYYAIYVIHPALISVVVFLIIFLRHSSPITLIFKKAYSGLDIRIGGFVLITVFCTYCWNMKISFWKK